MKESMNSNIFRVCVVSFSGRYLQMADFMGSDDDTRESTSVLDDGYAVDFLKAFVNDTGPSDVGKS